uniref:Uncharacterized protein n=1 Tax=Octopus bimaculoides TaxID=37653 RepID=A0A0L8G916_OCTBM
MEEEQITYRGSRRVNSFHRRRGSEITEETTSLIIMTSLSPSDHIIIILQ